jgi:hypothetical protein
MNRLIVCSIAVFLCASLGHMQPIHAKVTKAAFNLASGVFVARLELNTGDDDVRFQPDTRDFWRVAQF